MARLPGERPIQSLAIAFLKLGITAFGGPAAHIAMMEDEFVRRRAWLTREQMLDLVGAASLIPGPSSTEVAIYIGYRRAGWRGLLLAGACFIAPAALLVTAIAWAYERYGSVPAALHALDAVKAVVIAIVLQALLAFTKTAVKSHALALVGVLAAAANVLGAAPLAVLLGAGILVMLGRAAASAREGAHAFPLATGAGLAKLFLVFLKIGATVFGSGYVLLAFLRNDLVLHHGWLRESQLIDAVAIGQVTPGPVFTTATFIGYLLGGPVGAAVATIGIFLPSFVLVAISGPLIPRVRRSRAASAFLDGVNVASLALMAVVTIQLARAAIVDGVGAAIAVCGAIALLRYRVNSAWLVAGAAFVGIVRSAWP